VLVDLPLDVQMADVSYQPDEDRPLPWSKPAPDPEAIARAMDLIAASKAPVLLLGGEVILADATAEFRQLAEQLSLPVIMTYMGKGGLPHDHPLNAGHAGIQVGQPIGNRYFLDSDLVVGFGCRFTDRHTGKVDVYRGQRKFIHIDIEPSQIGRVVPVELGIVANVKLALVALLEEAQRRGSGRPGGGGGRRRTAVHGGKGERVTDARDLKAAFARGIESSVPYLVDVVVEGECDCSMGASIDAVREFV
jgi:tartronate-semialdehyde synthase